MKSKEFGRPGEGVGGGGGGYGRPLRPAKSASAQIR